MGRSLVLSFLIISVVFYTSSRPTDKNSGKIDYISAVKNHDFSAKSAEKRFFQTLRTPAATPKKQITQKKPLIFPSNNLLIPSPAQPKQVTMALPSARPKGVPSKPKRQIASSNSANNKKKAKFEFSALPSYLPFNAIAERTTAQKKRQEKNKLAQNKKNNVKVARIYPKELENELMDFQPVEHRYIAANKNVKAAHTSDTTSTKSNAVTIGSNPEKEIKTARLPKLALKVQQEKSSLLLTALPVKRAPFFQTPAVSPLKPIKVATIALPVKAFRSAPNAKQNIKPQKPVTIASYTNKDNSRSGQIAPKRTNKTHSRSVSPTRASTLKRLRVRNYALKRKRMRARLRQTQLRLKRKRFAARTRRTSKNERSRRRFNTAQNKRKVQQRLQKQRMKARRLARLERQSSSNGRRRIARRARTPRTNRTASLNRKKNAQARLKKPYLTKLRTLKSDKIKLTRKLNAQRKRSRRLARRTTKTRRRKVARLTQRALAKPKAALKKKISRRNKRYFNQRVGTQNKRLKVKLRAKNKTILRKINKKLRRKTLKVRKLAALKQRFKTLPKLKKRNKKANRSNKRKKKLKRKKFTKPRIRTQSKKRRLAKRSKRKRKRTRIARRRAAKKVFGFSLDGSID